MGRKIPCLCGANTVLGRDNINMVKSTKERNEGKGTGTARKGGESTSQNQVFQAGLSGIRRLEKGAKLMKVFQEDETPGVRSP